MSGIRLDLTAAEGTQSPLALAPRAKVRCASCPAFSDSPNVVHVSARARAGAHHRTRLQPAGLTSREARRRSSGSNTQAAAIATAKRSGWQSSSTVVAWTSNLVSGNHDHSKPGRPLYEAGDDAFLEDKRLLLLTCLRTTMLPSTRVRTWQPAAALAMLLVLASSAGAQAPCRTTKGISTSTVFSPHCVVS